MFQEINTKWEYLPLMLFLLISAAVMFINSNYLMFWDERWFAMMARDPFNITLPYWHYSPTTPALMWPVAILTTRPELLRIPAIITSLASLYLIYLILRPKTSYALLFFAPALLLTRLMEGTMWFYWDTYMVFFFLLTMYLLEKNNRWIPFITGTFLSLAKLFVGPLFLLPLLSRHKKLVLCLLPFALMVAVTPGLIGWPLRLAQQPVMIHEYSLWWLWQFSLEFAVIAIVFLGAILYLRRTYPVHLGFLAVTIIYASFAGWGISHTSTVLYGTALVYPLLVDSIIKGKK